MSPRLTANDPVYLADCYAEMIGNRLLSKSASSVLRSDGGDGVSSKFGVRELLSLYVATLCRHVFVVVGLGAKKQMVRIGTRRVVALVQDLKALWDWAVVKLPGKSMSRDNLPLRDIRVESAVSVVVGLSSPQPATVSLSNFLPESFCARGFFHKEQS